jgi:hypothetical protein
VTSIGEVILIIFIHPTTVLFKKGQTMRRFRNRDEVFGENPYAQYVGQVKEIPEGYLWCHNCQALTPHQKEGKTYRTDTCIVCGEQDYRTYACDNCGWSTEGEEPLEDKVVAHHDGCHMNQQDEENEYIFWISHGTALLKSMYEQWFRGYDRVSWLLPRDKKEYDRYQQRRNNYIQFQNMECGCPRYTVYRQPWVLSHHCNSYPSMDCSNALEFGETIRCPICGNIFEWEDTNC